MKKLVLLALITMSGVLQGYAQFSQAIKDSVLKLLVYPSASYSISFNFKPEDYVAANNKPDLQKLTRQQLNEMKKGDYMDASVYKALALKSWIENNNPEAAQYLTEAGQKYEQWINAEPNNTTPVDELLDMCISSKNYQPVPGILKYTLPLFPKHLPLLQKAIYFEQYVAKSYDKSRELINQARSVDSLDLVILAYHSGLFAIQLLETIQKKGDLGFTEIPCLKAAISSRENNNEGLQHLYYYHHLFYIYMNVVAQANNIESNSIKLFDFYTLTPQDKQQVDEAEKWMNQQLAKKGRNEVQLLNNLVVIKCIKKDYPAAYAYFDNAYQITKGTAELEGKILCQMFMDAFPEVEKLLEHKIALNSNIPDFGSLLRVYNDYSENRKAELTLLKKLQAINVNDPLRHQILATGFLKTGQTALLAEVLPLLGDADRNDILIKLVEAIVNDNRSNATSYLNNLLQLKPDDIDGLAIKKLTSL